MQRKVHAFEINQRIADISHFLIRAIQRRVAAEAESRNGDAASFLPVQIRGQIKPVAAQVRLHVDATVLL